MNSGDTDRAAAGGGGGRGMLHIALLLSEVLQDEL